MKKHLLLVLMSAAVVFGCKENKTEPSGQALTLSKAEVTLAVGGSEALSVTTPSEYANHPSLVWVSQDTDIATVDSKGKISAIRPGQVIVSAYVDGMNATRGEAVVKVSAPKLKLSKNEATINLNDILNLTFQYDAPLAASWEVKIATSDSIDKTAQIVKVTVDPNEIDSKKAPKNYDPKTGIAKMAIKGIRPGVVNVVVSNTYSPKVCDTIKVIVEPAAITDIKLALSNGNANGIIPVNGTTDTIKVTFEPASFNGLPVKFVSLDPYTATVDSKGIITPKGDIGDVTTILATTMFATNNITKLIDIELGEPTVKKIAFESKTATVKVGWNGARLNVKSEIGDQFTANVVADYAPKAGQKSNISLYCINRILTVYAQWDRASTGTAKVAVVSTQKDKNGKPITDTCLVTVAGFDTDAEIRTKTVYIPQDFNKTVAIKASIVHPGMQEVYTVNSIKLVAPKGSVYEGKKLDAEKVIEEITSGGTPIASGGVSYKFTKALAAKVNNVAEFKAFEVRYKITSQAGLVYEVKDLANTLDDGADFAPRR